MIDVLSLAVQLGSAALLAVVAARVLVARRANRDRRRFLLTFPRGLKADQLVAALRGLHGLLPPAWKRLVHVPSVVFEAIGTPEGIAHRLSVAAADADYVLGQLRAALPGIRIEEDERPRPEPQFAREFRPAGPGALRTDAHAATNASLLAALQPLDPPESVVVQWVLSPVGGDPLWRFGGFLRALRGVADDARVPPNAEPDFLAVCRVGVISERPAQLLARLVAGLSAASTPSRLLRRRLLPGAVACRRLWRETPLVLAASAPLVEAAEAAAVLGVPLEGPQLPGLTLVGARELAPLPSVPAQGRVLGDATLAGRSRPVALTEAESRRGLLVTAPTGGGKSTILENLCAQDFRAGRGVVVIESKGDLVASLCELVPAARMDDVIVFDPADPCPVGFNLLSGGEEAADLITDHVVSQFRSLYTAYLGPRSEMLLRAALLTLAAAREPYTVCEVIPLLTDPGFRRRLAGSLDDHVLAGVWAWFDGQTEAAQAEMTAPLVNKLAAFTLRKKLRAVVGQADAVLDFERILAERKILLVSLAKGLVGEDAAGLLGSSLLARLWAACQARAAVPPAERPFVSVVLDEAQDFLRLPIALGDAVAQSRGLGVGWTISHQNLGQLPPDVRAACLANLRSKLVLQTTAADAATFAREFSPHLSAADLQGLGPFEAYAAVSTGAAVAPPATIVTRPAPEPQGHGGQVRAQSRVRYGRAVAEVEAELRARLDGQPTEAPVGARRLP